MTKRTKTRKIRGIKIDVKDWDLGDWPDLLERCLEVHVYSNALSLELKLKGDPFEEVARAIVVQAIEAFLSTEGLEFTEGGLAIAGHDYEYVTDKGRPLLFPWVDMRIWSTKACDAMQTWLDDQRAYCKEIEADAAEEEARDRSLE